MNLKYFSDPEDAENFEPFPLVFSRGSVAYEGNGSSLQTNQPSFIEGSKGVYGLGVYERYTNLLTSSLSQDFNTAWTSGTLNGTYTITIKSGGGSITLSGGATGTVTSGNSLTFTVTSSTVTFTPSGSCLNTIIINKPYPLPWIIGGTTRQPDNCYIPKQEVQKFLDLNNASIETIQHNTPSFSNNTTTNFLMRHQGTGINNIFNIHKSHLHNNRLRYILFNNAGANSIISGNKDLREGVNLVSMAWNPKRFVGVQNKVLNGTPVNNPNIPNFHFNIFLGANNILEHNNGFIKSFIFSEYRSDAELIIRQKFAEANGYYPIDDKVTAFLDLESGLRGYRRTTQ